MVHIDYYLTFLTFIQIVVAVDFGLLYLDNSSRLFLIQDGWVNFIKSCYKQTMDDATRQLMRCREGMPRDIQGQRQVLKDLKDSFDTRHEREKLSRFMPSLGFLSGFFGLFMLIWIPLCAHGWAEKRMDILAVVMQAVLVSQFIYLIGYYSFKSVREQPMLGIILSIGWFAIYIVAFILWGIVYRCYSYDTIFYCSIVVPFVPLVIYVLRLLPMIGDRRKKALLIRNETALLKQMLEDWQHQV